jgi:hypothetical protein
MCDPLAPAPFPQRGEGGTYNGGLLHETANKGNLADS